MKMFSFHKHLFLLFFLSFVLNFVEINAENTVSVTISNGVINGKIETSLDGRQLNVFRGIPYAEPPVGRLSSESRCQSSAGMNL